jgi:hypothetical protein
MPDLYPPVYGEDSIVIMMRIASRGYLHFNMGSEQRGRSPHTQGFDIIIGQEREENEEKSTVRPSCLNHRHFHT